MADVQIPRGGDFNVESNGGPALKITLEFQSTNTRRPEMGFKFRRSRNDDSSGGASQDLCLAVSGQGFDKQRVSRSMEVDSPVDKGERQGGQATIHGFSGDRGDKSLVDVSYECIDGGRNSVNDVRMSVKGSDEGIVEAEQMEMEGGGVIATSL